VQNLENNSEGLHDKTRADMCIQGGLLFIWGVVHSFPFAVSVVALQKKTYFGTPKIENTLFMGRNKNQPSSSSPFQGQHACPI
jgi:hypothetical protein